MKSLPAKQEPECSRQRSNEGILTLTNPTRNGAWRWVAAVFIVALAVGLAYALKVGNGVVWPDEAEYHGIALNWLQGNGYSYFRGIGNALSPTMYRAPGLPAFLAGLYYVFGPSLLTARLAQAVLGATLVPVCFFLSRALGFSKRAAVLACLLVAVYPYYIFCAGAVYPIVLSTILLALANLALLQGRTASGAGWEAVGGALLGLTILTFGHVLGAAPFVALWVVFSKRAGGRGAWSPPLSC